MGGNAGHRDIGVGADEAHDEVNDVSAPVLGIKHHWLTGLVLC